MTSDPATSPGPAAGALRSWLWADPEQGPLPALLLVLTVVTGLVDAVSILSLGRVFVANMTGNVVFLGFAVAGAAGFSLAASLFALVGFLLGAAGGGRLTKRSDRDRGRLLAWCTGIQSVLLTAALGVSIVVSTPFGPVAQSSVALLLSVSMGLQNAVARRLAVPDLTTTVLTMTLTGIAADAASSRHRSIPDGRRVPVAVRRGLAVLAMALGAVAGALLVLRVAPWAALAVVASALASVTLAGLAASRGESSWQYSIKS